jgi:hypothetical protein
MDLTLLVNIIGGICGIFGLAFGIVSTWFIWRQVAAEKLARGVERALLNDHVLNLQKDLQMAHDKIRELEQANNDTAQKLSLVGYQIEENTWVLRSVELMVGRFAVIEERLSNHITNEENFRREI